MARVSAKPAISHLVASISEQLAMVCGDDDQVRRDCAKIIRQLSHPPSVSQLNQLRELATLLAVTDDFIALPVYEMLAEITKAQDKPWSMLKALLQAAEEGIAKLAAELTLELVNQEIIPLDRRLLGQYARLLDLEFSPFEDEDLLDELITTVRRHYRADDGDALLNLMRKDPAQKIRKLAARLLDRRGDPVSPENARLILGARAYKTLAPYLDYTRATHLDLYAFGGGKRLQTKVVDLFHKAGKEHGAALVRQVVSSVGWSNVSLGLRIDHLVEITLPGTLPLLVRHNEVSLFSPTEATVGRDFHLITTHGGAALKPGAHREKSDPIDRFRLMNITHAELLGEILDVVPLDKAKVRRINSHLDSVVETYASLFTDLSEDCSILEELWGQLRERVTTALNSEPDTGPLSAALTRLVLAFEEPGNLGEVRTVHGLKRYLHQRGLKLGFKMVDTTHSPNRTVNLLLVRPGSSPISSKTIRYAEFEAEVENSPGELLPFPVRILADALSRQLLYGTEVFPSVDVFIFGNEVHYYLAFRNHPAFLRVDYSPPQRGGMLDLEYYGVSNYEVDLHPNPDLDAIRLIFRKLDFDVRMEGMRLFVRYDKERSSSLGDLCDHVSALLRMAPYLMEVDWVIGSLKLPAPARQKVAEHWADRFRRSGVLPLNWILNKKRTGILIDFAQGPTGMDEILWDAVGSCVDCFSQPPPPEFLNQLTTELARLELPAPTFPDDYRQDQLPLLEVEKIVLEPVRQALRVGCVVQHRQEFHPATPDLLQVIHEAEYFATLLADGGDDAAAACRLARPLAELERFVEFIPSGFVGGLVVQRSRVTVLGSTLGIFVVRDAHGVIRLGAYCGERRLFRQRRRKTEAWRSNARLDAEHLWELLLSANYLAGALSAAAGDPVQEMEDLADLQAQARLCRPADNRRTTAGERILTGLKAAPGRAVGRALFGTEGRRPKDLDGTVLVARKICPTDNQFLYRSAGILSTGGAVLSHAALLAIQFGKPAMVAEAAWDDTGPVPALRFVVPQYSEEEHQVQGLVVCEREIVRRHTEELLENDLIILDADEGLVQIIGQDRDTLALWDGLRLLGEACDRADLTLDDTEVLEVRAQQLRARHQIQKIVDRLTDPVLTAFAVEEIVVGETMAKVVHTDKTRLLSRIMANSLVADSARAKLHEISRHLADCCAAAERAAMQQIPTAKFLYEILGLRLRAMHWRVALTDTVVLLGQFGVEEGLPACPDQTAVSEMARHRLGNLRDELLAQLALELSATGPRVRHLQRRIGRIGTVLAAAVPRPDLILDCQEFLAQVDTESLAACKSKIVLKAAECGLELHSLIGWKAANLAEIDRLAGADSVPPWFVFTNLAFKRVLKQPVGLTKYLSAGVRTLADAIRFVLCRDDLDNRGKSAAIRDLWVETTLPDDLRLAASSAYARLVADDAFVALRSSSCDEDTETVMRAGEFDSFLFVQGAESLLQHLLLTWSGLWTERALYSRETAGTTLQWPAGGVIVQRMVRSRVSGVLQTVNVARGDLRELLINVSLGLGEGIVSGLVAADLITVVKDFEAGQDPTHLNYLTNDKPEQMVFDRRRGWGTRLEETLYHQRLRPALEYFELCEIVAKASALENAYGYPLDIEFALEGARLWLLQVRPIATFVAELRKTVEHFPLCGEKGEMP